MADFPTNVASDGSLLIAANNVSSTLNGGINAAAVSMTLASSVNFPAKGGVTIESEAILYTANNTATSVLSGLTRGTDSTTAAIHADGTAIYMNMQARHHNALKDEVIAIESNISTRFGLGSTNVAVASGYMTRTGQPSFLAYNSVSDTNQTGSTNNDVTVQFDTELLDNTSNFAANTFTAPVGGQYFLQACIRVDALTAAMTRQVAKIKTSNRNYEKDVSLTPVAAGGTGTYYVTILADMDTNDTAFVTINIINGAGDTVTITGSSVMRTFFSGSLFN